MTGENARTRAIRHLGPSKAAERLVDWKGRVLSNRSIPNLRYWIFDQPSIGVYRQLIWGVIFRLSKDVIRRS